MIAGCFFIAWMGQLAHLLRNECDWRIVALARGGLAFLFAVALARLSGAKLVVWRPAALWLRGYASSISLLCTFFALSRLHSSEVMTLTNTFPIWVAFLSWPLLQVRPTISVWLAAACGVIGVALIESPHLDANSNATLAVALSLTAAVTSAIAILGLNRLGAVHPWAIVAHYSGLATIVVLVSFFVGPFPDFTGVAKTETILLLIGTGVVATLGQLCVTQAFTAGQPARVAVVSLMQVVFALGLDFIFDAPSIGLSMLAGIAFILLPTAWMMVNRSPAPAPALKSPEFSLPRFSASFARARE